MNDTPSGVHARGSRVLIAVWVGTYWLYEPSEPSVTYETGRPAAADRLLDPTGRPSGLVPRRPRLCSRIRRS